MFLVSVGGLEVAGFRHLGDSSGLPAQFKKRQ